MNFKKQCLLNACKLKGISLSSFLKMHKLPCVYTNEQEEELLFSSREKEFIAKELDVILPYFYGIIDDKELYDSRLTYKNLEAHLRASNLTGYLNSIGLDDYTYDLFIPSKERNPDKIYKDHLISCIYANKYPKLFFLQPSKLPFDEDICKHMVNKYPLSFANLPIKTEAVALEAVSKFAYAIEQVKEQTEAIALAAVQNNALALQHVSPELHTKRVILAALKQNPLSFRYSCLRDYDTCLEAVKANGINLEFVPDEFRDHNMIMTALNSNGWALMFLEEQTEEYALTALLQNTEACLNIDENIRNNNPHIQYIYDLVSQKHNFLRK